jgi:hypothetical protein
MRPVNPRLFHDFSIMAWLKIKNRDPVEKLKSDRDRSGKVFDRNHDRDENFQIRVCLKKFYQGPVKIFQSRSG